MSHRSARPNVRSAKPLAAKFLPALLAAASVSFSVRPLAALTLDSAGAAVGQWDFKVEGGSKACRLTLRSERVHGGYYVGIPAECRLAIPALGNVIAWGFPGDGRLDLADVYGAPLLYFSTEDGGDLIATGSQEETYRMTFVGSAPRPAEAPAGPRGEGAQTPATAMKPEPARAPPRPAEAPAGPRGEGAQTLATAMKPEPARAPPRPAEAPAGPRGEGAQTLATAMKPEPARAPPRPAEAPAGPRGEGAQTLATAMKPEPARAPPRPADVAGRYAVLREAGRDTGCMVTLDASSEAFLAPACRDQGIVIFDPVGWRIIGGRLTLTARKGHTTQLDLQPDGTWLKDAQQGKSLAAKARRPSRPP